MEKVNVNFEAKNLTGNSGLIPIAQFSEKLKIEEALAAELSIKQKPNNKYSVAHVIMLTMFGAIAGTKHVSQLENTKESSINNIPNSSGIHSMAYLCRSSAVDSAGIVN